jgi:NADH-quinone oxidoreductase subunit N
MKELLISSLAGIAVLVLDIINLRKLVFPFLVLVLSGLTACAFLDWGHNENPFNHGMLVFDNLALAFTGVLSLTTLVWLFLFQESVRTISKGVDLQVLVIFSLCGAIILAAFQNMVMLFLGVEILSIPLYVMAASQRGNLLSNEAGFKYFFMGAFASALLLFGIALVYGSTGTFQLSEIAASLGAMSSYSSILNAGLILILAGFAFKTGLAPFHFWTPDVYQGSPTPFTGLMATMVKGAAFVAMFRFFSSVSSVENFYDVMIWIAAITLIVANVVALWQSDVKRLLAYSSISHAGFMLGAILFASTSTPHALMYYVVTYSVASLASFAILQYVSNYTDETVTYDSFKGLVRRNPILAGTMTLALLSMAGIPPLSGFMAKYLVITGVIQGGAVWLAVIMILTSVVSVFYYLRLMVCMFTPLENAGRMVIMRSQTWTLVILSLLMVALFFCAGLLSYMF